MLAEILQPILLRRTKNSDIFDNQTKEEIIYVDLTDKERLVYSKLREGSSLLFKHLVNRNEANKQYIHIFQIIGKLRMACDHP
jgi:SNF2 family DNA or RNA helicase